MEKIPEKNLGSPRAYFSRTRLYLLLTLIILIALGVGGLSLIWGQSRNILTPTRSSEVCQSSTLAFYHDTRLGFGFVVPSGYRLATDLMQFLSASSTYQGQDWSPANTDEIVVTASTIEQEQAFVQDAKDGTKDITFTNVTSLPHSIYLTHLGLSQQTVIDNLSKPYKREVVAGLESIRYTDLANETVVVVPYKQEGSDNANKNESTFIKMSNASDSIDPGAFNSLLASFCYD